MNHASAYQRGILGTTVVVVVVVVVVVDGVSLMVVFSKSVYKH